MHFLKEGAEEELKPFLSKIRACICEGFEDYSKDYKEHAEKHELRTKAGIIRDHIVAHIKREFEGISGVQFFEKRNLFLLQIGKYSIRFKKLDFNLMPSNNHTQQSLWLMDQLILPEMAPTVYLNAGYVPNTLWSKINDVFITFQKGEEVKWTIDLSEDSATQPTLDISTKVKPEGVTQKRVHAKKEITRREEGSGGHYES